VGEGKKSEPVKGKSVERWTIFEKPQECGGLSPDQKGMGGGRRQDTGRKGKPIQGVDKPREGKKKKGRKDHRQGRKITRSGGLKKRCSSWGGDREVGAGFQEAGSSIFGVFR